MRVELKMKNDELKEMTEFLTELIQTDVNSFNFILDEDNDIKLSGFVCGESLNEILMKILYMELGIFHSNEGYFIIH